jgi:short-subunit dehydrogenase
MLYQLSYQFILLSIPGTLPKYQGAIIPHLFAERKNKAKTFSPKLFRKSFHLSPFPLQRLFINSRRTHLFLPIINYMSEFFNNKVVAITGGSEGIGRALVDALIPMGAKIATCGRNQDKLYNLQVKYSNHLLHSIVADVSRYDDCRNFIHSTIETYGGIDILINNAGISMRALLQDAEVEVIRKVMDINFFGTVYCTKLALNSIIERKGTIAGVSSIAGYRGLPGRSGYSASKFAMNGWLESVRTELLDTGVNVMWVSPGFTRSNIRHAALNSKGYPQGESPLNERDLMSSQECARQILRAIEKRKRTMVLSSSGKQTVFMNKFFPSLTDKLVKKFFYKSGELVK